MTTPLLRTLLAICQKSWEPSFWEVMNSFVLVAYASLAASRTLLRWLLACLNFTLENFFCWYKQKMLFLWNMAAAEAAENHGVKWGLTWYLQWGIYTSVPTWSHSQNSLTTAEPLILKISPHGAPLRWSQKPPQSAQEVISYKVKWGVLFWVYWKVNGNWDNKMIRILQWRESQCRTNTSVRRNK